MNPDLERLVKLQDLDSAAEAARRRLLEEPARLAELDALLAARQQTVDEASRQLGDSQTARRAIEKDLTVVQERLRRFRDQLMSVKTNKEFQAMQKEIATAEASVQEMEDRILVRMLEADELAETVKLAQKELAATSSEVAVERAAIEQDQRDLTARLSLMAEERKTVAGEMSRAALELFEHIARGRRGVAVTEARGGLCAECHVRLRPQVYHEVRQNDAIIQCENCQRILYFVQNS